MDKQVQEAERSLLGHAFRRDGFHLMEQRVLVLKTGVAGLTFYIKDEDERAALCGLTPGTELRLYREPENAHDAWAIAVHRPEGGKLGFITRYKNETIARLMDAGKRFVAIVDDPKTDAEANKIVEEERHRYSPAPTEDMALPISIYLVEEV